MGLCGRSLSDLGHSAVCGVLLMGAALAGGAGCGASASNPTGLPLANRERPVIVGHGGAKLLCAENTIPCYRLALELGARALEADLQVLGDGTLVMFHDDNTRKQTGVDRDVRSYDLAGFRELDAGWGYSPDDGLSHPERGQGIVAPTLEEFLEAFPDVPVLLDVKPESPAMSAALVAFATESLAARDRRRLYIKSNDTLLPELLRALEPPPLVAFSEIERGRIIGAPEQVSHLPASWIDLPPALVNLALAFAREHEHFLTVSTVDDPGEMAALLESGEIDGIVTNRPDLMANLLGRG